MHTCSQSDLYFAFVAKIFSSESKVMHAEFRINICVNDKNRARYILMKRDSPLIISTFLPIFSPGFSENTLNI